MDIQVDSREKEKAIVNILSEFDKQNIRYCSSKLFVGDYMSLDNPRLIIDRKQNLTEVYGNVIQSHKRFAAELLRAKEMGIKLIILVEHGGNINTLEDVKNWNNPRMQKYCFDLKKKLGIFGDIPVWALYKQAKLKWLNPIRPPVESEQLYRKLVTIEEKYCTKFLFCKKSETGKRIVELLGGGF